MSMADWGAWPSYGYTDVFEVEHITDSISKRLDQTGKLTLKCIVSEFDTSYDSAPEQIRHRLKRDMDAKLREEVPSCFDCASRQCRLVREHSIQALEVAYAVVASCALFGENQKGVCPHRETSKIKPQPALPLTSADTPQTADNAW